MNENDENLQSNSKKNLCITCLKTNTELYLMHCDFIDVYTKFVDTMKEESMLICNLCCWMFRRFLRFKHQCRTAKALLEDATRMDSKSFLSVQLLTTGYNLDTSQTEVHSYFGPQDNNDSQLRLMSNDSVVTLNESVVSTNESVVTTNESVITPNESVVTSNDLMVTNDESIDNDDAEYNNDDLPLVLLKRNKKIKRKKNKNDLTAEDIKPDPSDIHKLNGKKEIERDTNTSKGNIKKVKELKAGFTSRMVQETQEYIVIKLSKEQVLSEMADRNKTEEYQRAPFKCEQCVKGFNFRDVLTTHMDKHSVEHGSFQCDICFQYCPSAVSLRGHIKSHTTRYKCKLCGNVRLSRQHLLEHHAIAHTAQPATYTCHTCHFSTNKRTVMQRHVRRHSKSEPRACDKCGKLFKSIDSLRVHTMRHDASSRLQCPECSRTFVYASLLLRHARSVHQRRDYYCVECDTQFKSPESLRLHFKKAVRHRDSSTYKHACTECSLRFFTASSLAAHRASCHAAPKAYNCDICCRKYSSRDALRAHIYRTHRQKNPDTFVGKNE